VRVHYVGSVLYRGWCDVEGKPLRIKPGEIAELPEATALRLLESLPQWFQPVAGVMLEPPEPLPAVEPEETRPPLPQRRKPTRPRRTKG